MKIVTKTVLITDRKKPQIPAGTEVDLPKKLAEELLERGLVDLPVARTRPVKDPGGDSQNTEPVDDSSAADDDIGNNPGGDQ